MTYYFQTWKEEEQDRVHSSLSVMKETNLKARQVYLRTKQQELPSP